MEAYLDNAATTRISEGVKQIMLDVLLDDYGNPSSMHNKGFEAEKYIKNAKQVIAKSLKADVKEIIFTSGGTESNNMALIGAAMANKRAGKHIITTGFEHASVHNPLLYLEEQGFEVEFAPVDHMGHVITDKLVDMVREDTILVSVMYVNNELGCLEDIAEISKAVKAKNKNIIFHADAIQAYGKYKICPKNEGIDILTVSGHKIHGPKGSGFIYIKDKVKVKPIIYGGGQQGGMRSGTENVPAIAGLAKAAEEYYEGHEEKRNRLYALKSRLIKGLLAIDDVIINAVDTSVYETGNDEALDKAVRETAPHIVSAGFKNVRSEVLLHALEDKGVYVSSGSACSSNHPGISGSLKAIGVEKDMLDSVVRFSFSLTTTEEEIDYALEKLKELLPVLRRYTRH